MEALAALENAETDKTVPFYMEDEDEEKEARRQGTSEPGPEQLHQSTGKRNGKQSKKAIVKCPECKISFYTIDGYLRHKMGHAFAGSILV